MSEDVLGELLLCALHHATDVIDTALERRHLSIPKFAALRELYRAAGHRLPLSALACSLECAPSNVTSLVDRLVAEGLVRREDDPHDRRVKLAELTARGLEKVEEALPVYKAAVEGLLACLTREERAVLARVLAKLLDGEGKGEVGPRCP